MTRPAPVDSDDHELQHALGGVVLESAYMEHLLRAVFTALTGSKYAAVYAAGQNAAWLIGKCQAKTAARTGLSEDARGATSAALKACEEAYQRRNRVIHDVWARRPGGRVVTLRSTRKTSDISVAARSVPELRQLADDLASAAGRLKHAVAAALGPNCLQLENELRLEQGHDISTDLG